MWTIKLKASDEQTRKKYLTDTNSRMLVTREKRVVKSKGGQEYGDGKRFDFGW